MVQKLVKNAGQPTREFRLADYHVTNKLADFISRTCSNHAFIQVEKGDSVTKHMRSVSQKLWPKSKEKITCYTARHGIASDCKSAVAYGADPDLISQILGHVVDKTASFYGNRFQSKGISVVPSNV